MTEALNRAALSRERDAERDLGDDAVIIVCQGEDVVGLHAAYGALVADKDVMLVRAATK